MTARGAILLGVVFVLKLLVVFQLRHHPLLQPDVGLDTAAYVDLARKVLAGDIALGPGLYYVSPLYIYFLAAGLALTDSFTAIRVLQIILGTASVWFVFLAAREWFGERAAWLASGMAALTGLFTFYESLIMQASIDAVLTSAALLCLTFGLKRDSARGLMLAGLVFGIATLNRPNIAFGVAGITAALLIARRVRLVGLLLAGLIAGMAPVAVRNLVVSHQWSFASSHGGLNFYIGNSDTATGFFHQIPGITPNITGQAKDAQKIAEQAVGRPLTEAETSDYFYGLAWTWIRGHPADALALFARKLGYVFSAQHIALPHSYPFYAYDAGTMLRFYAIGPWLLVPLGLVGLVFFAPSTRRTDYLVWVSFVPSYAAGVAAFFIAERYRLPLLVPLCIGAGGAIDGVLRAISARRTARLTVPCVAFAIMFTFANWRQRDLHDGRWEEGLRLAEHLVTIGKYDEAERWVRTLELKAPRPGVAHRGVGMQLLAANQTAAALTHLSRAQQLDPGQPRVEYALGEALLQSGRVAEAVEHLRRGLSDQRDAESWLRVGRLVAQAKAPDFAESFFRRAVEIRPDQASARQQLGLNLLVLGRYDEAARELAEAVRLDPRDPDSLSHLAFCEIKLGRFEDGTKHAEAALAINPNDELAKQLTGALRRIR